MVVKVVTDSLGDLPAEVVRELGITVIPLCVQFGTEVYRDGVDLTTEQFYRKLMQSKNLPTTTVPSLGTFIKVYDRLAGETDEILVITISHRLSAVYDAALQAVERMKNECRVEVVDSQSAIMAQGLVVIEAAKAANDGASLDEVVAVTRRNIPRVDVRMAFDTLEYLKRGGRIGKAQAFLGSLISVNPILGIRDGEVFPFGRERSRVRAIEYLYDFVMSYSRVDLMAVEDATTPNEAEMLVKAISAKVPMECIYRSKVSPVIGTHVGPHVLGVAVLGETG